MRNEHITPPKADPYGPGRRLVRNERITPSRPLPWSRWPSLEVPTRGEEERCLRCIASLFDMCREVHGVGLEEHGEADVNHSVAGFLVSQGIPQGSKPQGGGPGGDAEDRSSRRKAKRKKGGVVNEGSSRSARLGMAASRTLGSHTLPICRIAPHAPHAHPRSHLVSKTAV